MPWWRNVLRLSPTKPRKPKPSGVRFKVYGSVVTVGWQEGIVIPQRPNSRTIFFGINHRELGGYAIAEEQGELYIAYWFGHPRDGLLGWNWIPIKRASSARGSGSFGGLSTELKLGYDQDGEDIWFGYMEGGLAYHAARWNVEV